jgi:hypothetical protein
MRLRWLAPGPAGATQSPMHAAIPRSQAGSGGDARTNVPALCDEYPQSKGHKQGARADPAVCGEGRRFVEVGLEHLPRVNKCVRACVSQRQGMAAERVWQQATAIGREEHAQRDGDSRTLPYFVVCAVTAEKGVSGSGASMAAAR